MQERPSLTRMVCTLVSTLVLLGACAGTRKTQPLLDRQWALQSFGAVGLENALMPDTEISLAFTSEGRVQGAGGCNRYFSTYETATGNRLSIQDIGSTRMWCGEPVMKQERMYLEALGKIATFKVEGKALQLFYNNGRGVLNFEAKD